MAKYFDKIPQLAYNIDGKRLTNYQSVTNILFRVRFLREAINNVYAYYEYLIKDNDTPEIIAEKVYGDPEAHWVILMANDIVDAQYDWPLNYDDFNKYIIGKYGSISNAKTTTHHCEKVVIREDKLTGTIVENTYVINESEIHEVDLDSVPYDTFDTLPQTQEFTTINLGNGKTVFEKIFTRKISFYDYEEELNESKRSIKIIKPEYYSQIVSEFNKLTQTRQPYIRRLI
jgi:nicotinamide riboside kinase